MSAIEIKATSEADVALMRSVFPGWLRREAARKPLITFWDNIGVAYDGDRIYVRMCGLGKHETKPKAKHELKGNRGRYYFVLRDGWWFVRDRILDSAAPDVRKLRTRQLAQHFAKEKNAKWSKRCQEIGWPAACKEAHRKALTTTKTSRRVRAGDRA